MAEERRMRLSTDGGCALCFGVGVVKGGRYGPEICSACGGDGQERPTCRSCAGTGRSVAEVPRGWLGRLLRLEETKRVLVPCATCKGSGKGWPRTSRPPEPKEPPPPPKLAPHWTSEAPKVHGLYWVREAGDLREDLANVERVVYWEPPSEGLVYSNFRTGEKIRPLAEVEWWSERIERPPALPLFMPAPPPNVYTP